MATMYTWARGALVAMILGGALVGCGDDTPQPDPQPGSPAPRTPVRFGEGTGAGGYQFGLGGAGSGGGGTTTPPPGDCGCDEACTIVESCGGGSAASCRSMCSQIPASVIACVCATGTSNCSALSDCVQQVTPVGDPTDTPPVR
jgi:hypothetical protein